MGFNREEVKDKVNKLREDNIPIYSISRLNTIDSCAYEYYQTYIKKEKGVDNIYRTYRISYTSE